MRRRMTAHVCPENIGSDDIGRQAVKADTSRQEVKTEQVKEKFVKAEQTKEIDYEKKNIHELRELARAEKIQGIFGKSKSELIDALKEGE